MNLWRYLGVSIFFVGMVCLIGTMQLAAGGGEGKDPKKDPKKDEKVEPKKDEKVEPKKDEKVEPKKDEKVEPKKDEKKGEAVTPKTGDAVTFKAFDKEFFQEQTTTTEQKIKVSTQEVVQKQTQTFIIKWTPEKSDGDNYIVTQQIVGVKMEIDIGGNKISYDSKANNPKNPMTEFFNKLTEAKLKFTIGKKDLKVTKVEGREEFIKGLSEINPQMQGLLKAILSDTALKSMAEPAWWAFPTDGTFTKDKTWEKDSNLDLGPIGSYATNFKFTAKGAEGGKEKVEIKTSLKYKEPTEKAGLPFIIHKADLKSDSSEGSALFDREKGRFEKTILDMKLTGKLTIEVGNVQTEVGLEQTQKAVSTTSDANPWGDTKGGEAKKDDKK
jgi:hypothetical protein